MKTMPPPHVASPMDTLEDIRTALLSQLGDEGRFRLVSARVTLRTGINLSTIPAQLSRDPSAVQKVIAALADMGLGLA
jgi:hypothetical protein